MDTLQGDDMVVPELKLERMFSMKGGNGETSYSNNSQAQARHARSMLHLLEGALNNVLLPFSDTRPFTVADLGCSCGQNTLFIVDVIVKHFIKKYEDAGCEPPEFQVFFSDLPSNDFNTLFHLLPPLAVKGSLEECLSSDAPRSYFAAGVPGSFYRRLFPANFINVFYSAFSLHWLSQVPESVSDARSAAYNKGRVFIHGGSEHTTTAYTKQFKTDLASFLKSRSHELKPGGSMFLVFLGRTSLDPTDQGGAGILFGTHFQDAWNDLVDEGLLDSRTRDSFNIPVYAANLQDVMEVVESDGSFQINNLEIFRGGSPLVVSRPEDPAEVGRVLANSCRSVCGVLVDAHVGEELSNEIFARLETKGASHARELLEQLQFYHIVASLSLR
ncbi:indole-3-acetate O-methyltransferase 1-like [Aristolochia californica]|uniref:indole-3-acetate O-methyltransferase 1-like n=1 Tax=Aristolochia californica TaxID=171875 RepID=UPI0035E0F7AF